jgi:hypothetical protein
MGEVPSLNSNREWFIASRSSRPKDRATATTTQFRAGEMCPNRHTRTRHHAYTVIRPTKPVSSATDVGASRSTSQVQNDLPVVACNNTVIYTAFLYEDPACRCTGTELDLNMLHRPSANLHISSAKDCRQG